MCRVPLSHVGKHLPFPVGERNEMFDQTPTINGVITELQRGTIHSPHLQFFQIFRKRFFQVLSSCWQTLALFQSQLIRACPQVLLRKHQLQPRRVLQREPEDEGKTGQGHVETLSAKNKKRVMSVPYSLLNERGSS